MHALLAKIVGLPGGSAWAQIHSFVPQEEDKKESHGQLIAIVTLKDVSGGIAAIETGREVISRLHEEYFGQEEGEVLGRLKNAVSRVSGEFSSLSPEFVCSVLWKKYAYICLFGAGQALLLRDKRIFRVIAGKKGIIGSVSGEVKGADVLFIGTEDFFGSVKGGTLTKVLSQGLSPQEAAEELAPFVHKPGSSASAAVVVEIGEIEKEKEKEIEIEREAGVKEQPPVSKKISLQIPRPKFSIERVPQFLRRWMVFIASRLPEKGIYLKKDGSSRRTAVSVGIILIILLAVSIFFGVKQKGVRQYQSSYQDRLIQAESFYNDSLLQEDVDRARSRELFLQAEATVNELLSEGVKDKKLGELKQKMEDAKGTILGIVEVVPNIFQDLSILREGVSSSEIAQDQDVLAVFDKGGSRIISISAENKETRVISGPEKLGDALGIAIYQARYFAFTGKGVLELDRRGNDKVVIKPDTELSTVVKIMAFGGNIYLFSQNGEVWRYPALEDGFGTKQRWLGKGFDPQSAQGIDFAIDGSLWVLKADGKIAKFSRGSPESFKIKSLPSLFLNPTAIYTDEELDTIFVLDKGNNRVLEIGKDGEFKKQYALGDMGEMRDMVVSKKTGKIFLLTEKKILEVGLR